MNMKFLSVVAVALIQLPVLSSVSFADAESDQVYNSARNQLGLIKYCAENGHVPAETVDAYEKIIAMLPAASDVAESEKFEAEGVKGNSYDGTQTVSLEEITVATGSTVAAHCSQYEMLTKQ